MRVINARRAMTLSRLGTGLTGERSALFDWSREGSLIDMIRSASGSRHGLFVAVPQPLVIKILTDDPDVVIYWITEPNGE